MQQRADGIAVDGPPAQVTSYHVLVYGGPDSYQTNRAQIQLSGTNGVLAWLRFNDPEMDFESRLCGRRDHLDASAFDDVPTRP